jgi:hypothetical protein
VPLFDAKANEAVMQVSTRISFGLFRPMMNITISDRTYVVKSGTHYFDVAAGERVVSISLADDSECEARTTVRVEPGECAVVRYRLDWSTPKISVGAPLPIAIARART